MDNLTIRLRDRQVPSDHKTGSWGDLLFVFHVVGILVAILGVTMLFPLLVDWESSNADWHVFVTSAGVCLFTGITVALATYRRYQKVDRRKGYLLTVLSWVIVGLFGSLPLAFSSLNLSFTDAFFETMSALTTTGSTVLVGLDHMAPGLLIWRSILQWIGGIGIVVMALVMLPFLRIGGMQLFKSESSDVSDKLAPQIVRVAGLTVLVYVSLSLACLAALIIAGMPFFDAVNHAMATIATGGFSTKDASVGYYDSPAIEAVLIIFMMSGALPLVFYARIIMHGRDAFKAERQIPTFLAIWILAIGIATVIRHNSSAVEAIGWLGAFRQAAFNVTSVLTDTGFATTDFSLWGSGAIALFMGLLFIGGCAGSTSGSIKVFRWQLLFGSIRSQLVHVLSPNRVVAVRYRGKGVDDETISVVRNFFFLYMVTWAVLSFVLMLSGLDYLSATSAIAQAMAGAGPGLGPIVGPGTNFLGLSDFSKYVLVAAMLLGRLELATVYVLFLKDFWRK